MQKKLMSAHLPPPPNQTQISAHSHPTHLIDKETEI